MLMGQWFLNCKEVVEKTGGTMNKYLGDGFLAFWKADEDTTDRVASLTQALNALQDQSHPAFRYVLHLGEVFIGGGPGCG